MVKLKLLVTNEKGLTGEALTKLVNNACLFDSHINIESNGKISDAKSVINLMALDVCNGDEIILTAVGDDAQNAIDSMHKICLDEGIVSK